MSLAQKNNNLNENWRPSATIATLQKRASILKTIRDFFYAKQVLEVETPLLSHTSVTDPFIQSIPAALQFHPQEKPFTYFLQTSPEYAMKRLLAAGSGAVYQITKAFRQGEVGKFHNPEFTMLEWYRIDFTHHDLMNDMDELLQAVLSCKKAERKTYAELFLQFLEVNPHEASIQTLKNCAAVNKIEVVGDIEDDKDTWLNLLMTHIIEPQLGLEQPCFVYDFPASQAALARIQAGEPDVAARFEVYVKGIELANGFYELADAEEQRKRFNNNNKERGKHGLTELQLDENFLAALSYGLPDCAGVALGIDRLIMLATGSESIADVISFDIHKA